MAALLVTDFIAEMLAGTQPFVSAVYAFALAGDAVLSSWLLLRFLGEGIAFTKIRHVVAFLVFAVLFSNAVMSLAAAAASLSVPGATFVHSSAHWSASDGVGNLLVTPFLLSWAVWLRTRLSRWNPKRALEGAALIISMALLNVAAFSFLSRLAPLSLLLPCLTFPFLLWAALRFGTRGVASALLALAALVVPLAAANRLAGISSSGSPLDAVVIVQFYLAIVAIPSLFLAAVVTERRRAEEALRVSEALYHNLVETSQDLIWQCDAEGRYTYLNPAWEQVFGYKTEEMLGRRFIDFQTPEMAARDLEEFNRLMQGNTVKGLETTHIGRSGNEINLVFNARSLFDENGKIRGTLGTAYDITERKRAEEALREREQRLASIYDTVGDVIFQLAVETVGGYRFTSVNPAFLAATGLTSAQVVGKRVDEVIPEPSLSIVLENYAAAIRAKEIVRWEETSEYPTGRLTGEVSIAPIFDADGNCTHMVGAVHDITARKRAEETLREAHDELEQRVQERTAELAQANAALRAEMAEHHQTQQTQRRLLAMLEATPDFVGFADARDTHILYINKAGRRLCGLGEDEDVTGLRIADVHPEWTNKLLREKVLPVAAREGVWIGECAFLSRTGREIPVLMVLMSHQAPGGEVEIFSTISRDITERKQLEQELGDRTAQLEFANKELDAFAYSVSHDLRAPLRGVSGFAQIIARRHRAGLDDQGRHYVDNIVQASERMGRLIDDLLAYSRLGRRTVHLQPVPLREVFDQVQRDLADRIQETGATLDLPADWPVVHGDATLLSQVFANLLDNALTYRRPGVAPHITVACGAEPGYDVMRVGDNGIGIPAEYHEMIFNAFQRLHNEDEYPGTGIGLAAVKKAMELLGGEVGVESVPGQGSTFRIKLPREESCALNGGTRL